VLQSIYRKEGGSPEEPLDMTVASFQEDVCPLRRSEGDVFYRISGVFVESDRRSQPTSPRGYVTTRSGKYRTIA
jgi:hypothetical protein